MPELTEFEKAVERHCEGIDHISSGICSKCPECQSTYNEDDEEIFQEKIESQEVLDEGFFSWSPCDSCGASFGGNRYNAHGFVNGDEIIHLDICEDCLQYFANGTLPENWK
jgi:hypothetical protein